MGAVAACNALKDFAISSIPELNVNNCKVEDMSVFDAAVSDLTNNNRCAIVSFDGTLSPGQKSEYGGTLLGWAVTITGFFLLYGTDEDAANQALAAIEFVDDMMNAVTASSTMGGTVMDTKLFGVDTPREYVRADNSHYIMMRITFMVRENLS